MFNGKTHYKWWFSISMLDYQRVSFAVDRLSFFTDVHLPSWTNLRPWKSWLPSSTVACVALGTPQFSSQNKPCLWFTLGWSNLTLWFQQQHHECSHCPMFSAQKYHTHTPIQVSLLVVHSWWTIHTWHPLTSSVWTWPFYLHDLSLLLVNISCWLSWISLMTLPRRFSK